MDIKAKVKKVENKPDYYDVEIKTYKQTIEGRFERSEIRNIIETLDNSITVGLN